MAAAGAVDDDCMVRRACCLVAWYDTETLVLENYLTGRQTELHPGLIGLLASWSGWRQVGALIAGVPTDVGRSVVSALVAQDVLLVDGSRVELLDRQINRAWVWGHDARYFHYSTRRTAFTYDLRQERDALVERARLVPPPVPFTDYGRTDVKLGNPVPQAADMWGTLTRRRTGRRFGRQPMAREALETILAWTWGISEIRVDEQIGPVVLKTSPSGGARHPVEVYPVVLNVADIEPGVYHYCSGRHVLERIHAGNHAEWVLRACTHQPWVTDCAVVFFMTGVIERMSWKYRQAHAYRVMLLDAGHLGQTFHLSCTAMGLAPWTSAALDEAAVVELLELDGASEVPLYVAACGVAPGPGA